jgi:cytochrome P450
MLGHLPVEQLGQAAVEVTGQRDGRKLDEHVESLRNAHLDRATPRTHAGTPGGAHSRLHRDAAVQARAIERVRANPDDGLLSRLANTETDGRLLEMRELQSLILQILVAGNETNTTTLASGMRMLLQRPELVEHIRTNPDRVRPFIEETLRVAAPLQTLFRRATTDVVLHGVTIPAGSMVEVRFGAGNRDPRKFECPADVDLERKDSASHLSFGAGIHSCVGNQLARSETVRAEPVEHFERRELASDTLDQISQSSGLKRCSRRSA